MTIRCEVLGRSFTYKGIRYEGAFELPLSDAVRFNGVPFLAVEGSMMAMVNNGDRDVVVYVGNRPIFWKVGEKRFIPEYFGRRLKKEVSFLKEVSFADTVIEIQEEWGLIRNGGLGDIIMLLPVFYALLKKNSKGKLFIDDEYEAIFKHDKRIISFREAEKIEKPKSMLNLSGYVEHEIEVRTWHRTDAFAYKVGIKLEEIDFGFDRIWEGKNSKKILFFPEARADNRLWKEEYWDELADRLIKRGYIVEGYGFINRNGSWWRGKLENSEAKEILSKARAVVCLDSGFMHLAGAMGVPCLAMFSSFPAKTRAKYYKSVFAVEKEVDCRCFDYVCRKNGRPCMEFSPEEVEKWLISYLLN